VTITPPQNFQDLAVMMGRVDERTHEMKRTNERIEGTIKQIKSDMEARLKSAETDIDLLKSDKDQQKGGMKVLMGLYGIVSGGVGAAVTYLIKSGGPHVSP